MVVDGTQFEVPNGKISYEQVVNYLLAPWLALPPPLVWSRSLAPVARYRISR